MNAGELADGAAFDARLGAVDAENSVLLGASFALTQFRSVDKPFPQSLS